MGIKGTVRRSTDGDYIHANVDIDLIISEENKHGSIEKPVEIFHIIEHFCLGKRRYFIITIKLIFVWQLRYFNICCLFYFLFLDYICLVVIVLFVQDG